MVKDLTELQLDGICVLLDSNTVVCVPKYRYIVEAKFKNEGFSSRERNTILNGLCNGGNKGLLFLDHLASYNEDLTLGEFCKVAVKLKRNDIKNFLKETLSKEEEKLCELNFKDKIDLASMLSRKIILVAGWRYFADEFKFSNEVKDAINNVSNSSSHSPSRVLLEQSDLFTVMPLSELNQLCKDNGFTDVTKEIEKIMGSV